MRIINMDMFTGKIGVFVRKHHGHMEISKRKMDEHYWHVHGKMVMISWEKNMQFQGEIR